MKNLVLIILILLAAQIDAQEVVMSEVMSDNDQTIDDFEGNSSDWIELVNIGDYPINMEGWHLSDDNEDKLKWTFPEKVLNVGERLIVFASGKDLVEQYHTNFKISADGEDLFLSDANGSEIDFFPATCMPEDVSVIVNPSDGFFYYSAYPSPGALNPTDYDFPCRAKIAVDHAAGYYPSSIEVKLTTDSPYPISLTVDGSVPDLASNIYLAPIQVREQAVSQTDLSFIPSSEDWTEPGLPIPKASVVRAQAFYDECAVSNALTETYFIGDEMKFADDALVFSVSTDKDGFFSDEDGIYVPGSQGANFLHAGDNWERDCHLEVFEDGGQKVIDQDCQVKNRGKSSRYKPQKSLRFTAKSKYGNRTFDHPVFEKRNQESYKSINLRSGQAGFTQSMFADVLASSLMNGLHLDYQESQLAIMYLNGEYWGIHDARENLDEHYLSQYYGMDKDSLIILKNDAEVLEGSNAAYLDLRAYIQNNDLSKPSKYEYVQNRMDVKSFIDFNVMHMYAANWDWPHNNVEYWKTLDSDSKFRWFFFDCDACFYKDGLNSMEFFTDPTTSDWDKVMLSKLFTNDDFRRDFTIRLYQLISTNFKPSNVLEQIDSLEQLYAPFMHDHIQRWNMPTNYSTWQNHVQEMKIFALTRPQKLINLVQDNFGSPLTFFPNPTLDVLYTDLPDDMEGVQITVFDALGRVKLNELYTPGGIDVSGLSSGLHTIRVQLGEVSFSERIVKI